MQASTPVMDALVARYPRSRLQAAGEAVGLQEGQMGNSNVGHLNLGAGRIVYQDLVRISRSIRDGSFFRNEVLLSAVRHVRQRGSSLHVMGLVSDGGVHSHLDHLFALIDLFEREKAGEFHIHCFLDGRDVSPASAGRYLEALEERLGRGRHSARGRVATISGRYYAMDRDLRWDRTEKAFQAMVRGQGERSDGALEALAKAYARGETDEFVRPTVIGGGDAGAGNPVGSDRKGLVGPADALIFFNFRADRARQITRAFTEECFAGFPRAERFHDLFFAGFTRYDEDFRIPYAFPPHDLNRTFGEVVSEHGLRQLRIAETEKYAHVTYFFSGGREEPFPGEDRRLIPSPAVATYDLKPEMSAYEVAAEACTAIGSGSYDVIVLNFANPDMVGHTGVMGAAVRAIEAVDRCLGQVLSAVTGRGGAALVVADHGNAEQMVDYDTGSPQTAHTTNPVPCILVDDSRRDARLKDGVLANVAPTLLDLLGIQAPPEMTEESLLDQRRRKWN